jgi:prepilin-type processing-associated H-X9-DG protein
MLVVITVLGLLIAIAPRSYERPNKAQAVRCMSNLKQIALGLNMFAVDHGNEFPPCVSVTNGGSMELLAQAGPAAHFRTLSNNVSSNLDVWVCPTDRRKQGAASYSDFGDKNLSYFLNLNAAPVAANAQFLFVAGERHLEVNGYPIKPGLFRLAPNDLVGWTRELHPSARQSSSGSMVFVDGHVEFLRRQRILGAVNGESQGTNLLAVP